MKRTNKNSKALSWGEGETGGQASVCEEHKWKAPTWWRCHTLHCVNECVCVFAKRERERARDCREHWCICLLPVFNIERYVFFLRQNSKRYCIWSHYQRCYWCKTKIMRALLEITLVLVAILVFVRQLCCEQAVSRTASFWSYVNIFHHLHLLHWYVLLLKSQHITI